MIAVIGATGFLGSKVMEYFSEAIECPIRFDDANGYKEWFDSHDVDTVIHLARCCKKSQIIPRRTEQTFLDEIQGIKNILSTKAKDCKFIYASTKIMTGKLIDNKPITRLDICKIFKNWLDQGTTNKIEYVPNFKEQHQFDIQAYAQHHKIYSLTKLAVEGFVQVMCKNFVIARIGDITR